VLLTAATVGVDILTNPDLQGPQVTAIFRPTDRWTVPATTAITVQFNERIDVDTVRGTSP